MTRQQRLARRQALGLVFGNIGRGPMPKRLRALALLRARCTRRTIVVLVELDGAERTTADRLWPRRHGWQHFGPGQTRIIVGPTFNVTSHDVRVVYPAVPHFGPTRHLVEVQVIPTWTPGARPTIVLGTHLPADFGHWRAEYLEGQRVGWSMVTRRVATARRHDKDVLAVADWNVHGHDPLPVVAPRQQLLWRRGYDAALAFPSADTDVVPTAYQQFSLGVEPQHHGHRSAVALLRKASRPALSTDTQETPS